jgi:hypothetical protein
MHHGAQFVHEHLRLRADLVLKKPPIKFGRCRSCEKQTKIAVTELCEGCSKLVTPYLGDSGRLADNTFLLITEMETKIYVEGGSFTAEHFPDATFVSSTKRAFLRMLVTAPPSEPYVVLLPSRKRFSATDIFVNYDQSFIKFSLNPLTLGTTDTGFDVWSVNREVVAAILEAHPHTNQRTWLKLFDYNRREEMNQGVTPKEANERDALWAEFADVMPILPRWGMPEYTVLRAITK